MSVGEPCGGTLVVHVTCCHLPNANASKQEMKNDIGPNSFEALREARKQMVSVQLAASYCGKLSLVIACSKLTLISLTVTCCTETQRAHLTSSARGDTICPGRPSFDPESGVRVTCDVCYLCANFSLPRPLCSRVTPDVRDRRQTDRRQMYVRRQTASLLNVPA